VSLHPGTGALEISRLEPPALPELLAFLDEDPVQHVYWIALALRDALARPRDAVWAARRDGAIVAIVHLAGGSGAVLPLGEDAAALERLARIAWQQRTLLPRRAQIIGPRRAATALARAFAEGGAHPRLSREQTYFALEARDLPAFARVPELRAARPEDHDRVFESGAELRAEELEEDPRTADAAAYARRVEEECRDGYTYLWLDAAGLRFRASISAATPAAVQISGVFTPPSRRRLGYARRAISEICTRWFERSRVACLFVNDFNTPAIALYRALGFRRAGEWASYFFDSVS
jgi:ribosomal protein S18 acetylase RimI-like enzyme